MSDENKSSAPPYLTAICVASFVVLVAAIIQCRQEGQNCKGDNGWALACGVLSFLFTLIVIIAERFAPSFADRVTPGLSLFLMVWWGVGAGVCTFRGPFLFTGNGYFGCWVAFFCSVALAATCTSAVGGIIHSAAGASDSQSSSERALCLVLVASVVDLVAAASLCDTRKSCTDEPAWAVAAGVLGIVASAAAFVCHRLNAVSDLTQKLFAGALLIIWIPGAGVSTFSLDVFPVSGNGYFAAWLAFIASVIYAGNCYEPLGQALDRARLSVTRPPPTLHMPPQEGPSESMVGAPHSVAAPPYVMSSAPPANAYPPPPPQAGAYQPSAYPPPTYPPSSGGYQ